MRTPVKSASILFLSVLFVPPGLLWAQASTELPIHFGVTPPDRYAEAARRAGEWLLEFREAFAIPGLSMAVAVDGEIVWSEAVGYADLEGKIPATPQTRFRIGSVSKPLTAAAIMLLRERKRLDIDAPIHEYVPSFPDTGHIITTRQLAGHLAGVRHYEGDEAFSSVSYESVLHGLTIFQNDKLLHPPGTKFSYSSYGWNLISAVIEGAANEDFLTFMDDQVFQVLGMKDTCADRIDVDIPNRTSFYELNELRQPVPARYVDNSYKWAAGGFLSTPEDLVRFASAHLRPGFLTAESFELLFTSQRTDDGRDTGYGIGWEVVAHPELGRFARHLGGLVGGVCGLLLNDRSGVVFALAGNLNSDATGQAPDPMQLYGYFVEAKTRRR